MADRTSDEKKKSGEGESVGFRVEGNERRFARAPYVLIVENLAVRRSTAEPDAGSSRSESRAEWTDADSIITHPRLNFGEINGSPYTWNSSSGRSIMLGYADYYSGMAKSG